MVPAPTYGAMTGRTARGCAVAKRHQRPIAAIPPSISRSIAGEKEFGLRTFTGAEILCAIRSDLSTARKPGINALDALTQIHNGSTWMLGTS